MKAKLAPDLIGNGLEALVEQIQVGGVSSILSSWHRWLERAMCQLETDDTLDARLTDVIVERLTEVEEAIEQGSDATEPLQSIASLFLRGEGLEADWAARGEELTWDALQTPTFRDLQKALLAAEQKRFGLVELWIERVERRLFSLWEQYELATVLPEEVTTESVLGHRYLSEGLEGWLEALALFRSTLRRGVNRDEVLAQAEAAQRLLLVVQRAEDRWCSPFESVVG